VILAPATSATFDALYLVTVCLFGGMVMMALFALQDLIGNRGFPTKNGQALLILQLVAIF